MRRLNSGRFQKKPSASASNNGRINGASVCVCVCARVWLWRWLGKLCHMSYHYSAIPQFRELCDCPSYSILVHQLDNKVFESYFILKNWVISGKHNCSRCCQQRSKGSLGREARLLLRGQILWTNRSNKYKWINDVLQWRNLWANCSMYKASFQHNFIWSHNQILRLHVFASLIISLHMAIKWS